MRTLLYAAVVALWCGLLPASGWGADPLYPVGVRQLEYVTAKDQRPMWMAVFYPAVVPAPKPPTFRLPFTIAVEVYPNASVTDDGTRRPLVMMSHGRGSDAWQYAWFAEALAARGYIVVALNHYRANSYDREIAYLANRIWQRPVDISLDITHLLDDPFWGPRIDRDRIGVAGHSQGGFTALWIGGARVNADRFLAFQRHFVNDERIPAQIRGTLPLDAAPALDVKDPRVKAVFAMAPGIVQAFGMDPDGLRHLDVPAFLTVGARDTQAPPKENAEFAARYIPDAELWVIPGLVDHEIFTNECDEEGRNEFPEGCIDAPGVDRHALHGQIANAALKFFDAKLGAH